MKRIAFSSATLLLVGILLASCIRAQVSPSCSLPEQLDKALILGEWSAHYSNQWVSDPITGTISMRGDAPVLLAPGATPLALPECKNWDPSSIWERCARLRGPKYQMEGQEIVQFFEDGTYLQRFTAQGYSYISPLDHWELDLSSPDSPRIRMEAMKYFAAGVGQANSPNTVSLSAQMIDRLRIQKSNKAQGDATSYSSKGVIYPDDGFIYLYPRSCDGRLALVQMVFGSQDPDDTSIKNPVFRLNQARSW